MYLLYNLFVLFFLSLPVAAQSIDVQTQYLGCEAAISEYFKNNVISRASWGAKDPNLSDITPENQKNRFAVHHTAGHQYDNNEGVQNIQNLHMNINKWADIGYHFVISHTGQIWEGRELKWMGAHVKGHNKENIGITLMGCYDERECPHLPYPGLHRLNDKMLKSMGELIGYLAVLFQIPLTPDNIADIIMGHRQFSGQNTSCPGTLVLARLDEIRQIANETAASIY